jgi:2-keto-4-pentenoate hydratase/2-oxohepta-3-ene-1,7-dioic acid hydratase in catechol pathway
MKLATYLTPDGRTRWGILTGSGLVDVSSRQPAWPTLLHALQAGLPATELHALAQTSPDHELSSVQLLPPLPEPPKLVMIGLNYRAHQKELGLPEPKYPVVIARFPNSQVGHGQPVLRPKESEQLDYEGELAVIVGRRLRRASAAEAQAAVAGYACYMDGTVRDFQKHTSQVTPAKSFPATGAFGPWMVTADDISDPAQLDLVTRLNGQVVQRTSTSDMIWTVGELLSYLSTFLELQPGDVVATGTTSGVGAMRQPPLWLKAGDLIEVEIAGIGTLANPVEAEA